jgi:hypothetical protein
LTRTSETTVTFRQPFTLSAFEGELPPGAYRVLIDEEEIPGISFLAYRRVATSMEMPANPARPGTQQILPVDQTELDTALLRDAEVVL